MIINHPVVNRFSPAIREVEPVINDDKLIIPATFNLVGLPPEPLIVAGASAGVQESSFSNGNSFTVTNAGPTAINLATLRNGYWRCRFYGCFLTNYTSVLQGGDFTITLLSATQTVQLVTLYAIPGTQIVDTTLEFLIAQNHIVNLTISANGVGQTAQVSMNILANKLL